ncbi:MAG: VOC family protein [Bacillota bacterium]
MAIHPQVIFNGNCKEALAYYEGVFGVTDVSVMHYGDTPGSKLDEDLQELILEAAIPLYDEVLLLSDAMPGKPATFGSNFHIAIRSEDLGEMKADFEKLAESGTVIFEFEESYWSEGYGVVQDKFGVQWQFDYRKSEAGSSKTSQDAQ